MKIKTILLPAILLATSLNASAFTQEEMDQCKAVGEGARTIMRIRQMGLSMSDAMEAVGTIKVLQMMVSSAYKRPAYSTKKAQIRAVNKFQNDFTSLCYERILIKEGKK